MNKHLKQFKNLTLKILESYKKKLNLHNYQIDLEYIDDKKTEDIATISDDPVYLYATVRLYPKLFNEYKKGNILYIKKVLLHELCHTFTDKLSYYFECLTVEGEYITPKQFSDEIETATQKITNILSNIPGFLEIE